MLGKVPAVLGHAMRNLRAGLEKVTFHAAELGAVPDCLTVRSEAFAEGELIPSRYTADGEQMSPPLTVGGLPERTASLVLMIEDADSPSPEPLVHAIAHGLGLGDTTLAEGALQSPRLRMGLNSFLQQAYLPPDPPPGHGPHRYVFQVFALDAQLDFASPPGRTALLSQMHAHVLAKGCLVGVYERARTV